MYEHEQEVKAPDLAALRELGASFSARDAQTKVGTFAGLPLPVAIILTNFFKEHYGIETEETELRESPDAAETGDRATAQGDAADGPQEAPAPKKGKRNGERTPRRARKERIRSLQGRLNELGYRDYEGKPLKVDGILGRRTKYAVILYKQYADLSYSEAYDGDVSETTWEHLFSDQATPSRRLDSDRSLPARIYIMYYQKKWTQTLADHEEATTVEDKARLEERLTVEYTKERDIRRLDYRGGVSGVVHKVPVFRQGRRKLCWAYSQAMVEAFFAGGAMTQEQADARAREISEGIRGPDDWNGGGFPSDSPDVGPTLQSIAKRSGEPYTDKQIGSHVPVDSFDELSRMLEGGPVYGYYSNKSPSGALFSEDVAAHSVVITGTVSAAGHPNLVVTNNPWGKQNIQTYEDFLSGIPGDRKSMTFRGVQRVNLFSQ